MKSRWLIPILFLLGTTFSVLALADEQAAALSPEIAAKVYNPQGNVAAGNPNGSITLVEFFDYNCHFCRALQPTLEKIIAKNPDLRVVYKEYLLFGPFSLPATAAALAAQTQGQYLKLHNALLKANRPLDEKEVLKIAKEQGFNTEQLKTAMHSPEVKEQIIQNEKLVERINLDAAPAFYITSTRLAHDPTQPNIPQYFYVGSEDAQDNLQKLIDQVRKG